MVLVAAVFGARNCLAQHAQVVGIALRAPTAAANRQTVAPTIAGAYTDEQSHVGNWIVLGALAGGIAGGIWAAVQIAHSDDPMLANAAFGFAIGAGALLGGLAGAFAYLVSNSPNQAP